MPSADVFIQAGHKGRTTGNTGATSPLGNEIEWTPIVADEAIRIMSCSVLFLTQATALDKLVLSKNGCSPDTG